MRVPGDKSISHRAVILAGIAGGETTVTGFLPSDDCLCTLAAMRAVGAEIDPLDGQTEGRPELLRIRGVAGRLQAPEGTIDCGNSGTAMRLLSGLLAAQPFASTLVGDASLSGRPMGRIITPLSAMGARMRGQGDRQTAPLEIEGGKLRPIEYSMPVASAQVKSAILLAGLFAEGETWVVQPAVTRDHSERMLRHFGVPVLQEGQRIGVRGPAVLKGRDFVVPGDISSAAFWLVAAAAAPGSDLTIEGVGLNETRAGVLAVLRRMGVSMAVEVCGGEDGEPWGNIRVRGGALKGTVIEGAEIANVIDEIPVLAVAAALAEGETVIRDAAELRVKESDRIHEVVRRLQAMGAEVEEKEDGMRIQGGRPLHGAEVSSEGDHRIAMAFAIAGLFASGHTKVTDVGCVATSYPGFDRELARFLEGKYPVIAIDGPAASGKSSVARIIAERLGWSVVNSGAFYRGFTWAVLQAGVDPADHGAVEALASEIDFSGGIEGTETVVRVEGRTLRDELTSPAVNAAVSEIARVASVRQRMVGQFRALAEAGPLVMEGRDIGSVVFPDTRYKLYIQASPEVREQRRSAQGQNDSIRERDRSDSERDSSPLRVAEGARVIDSSQLSLSGTAEAAFEALREQGLVIS